MAGNPDEDVYQYYTVINNLVLDEAEQQENIPETTDDNDHIVYVTVPSVASQNEFVNEDVEEEVQTPFLDDSDVTENSNLSMCNLKFVALPDGQMFLTTDTLEDNLTSIQPQLLTVPEETTSSCDGSELVEDVAQNDEEYHEIKFTDGLTALIDDNLFKLIKIKSDEPSKEINKKVKRKGDFMCTYINCLKTFTSAHHLAVHTRLHTGSRPYSCTVEGCDKTFVTSYSLKAHTRTHTGEKPYGCGICIKHFKTAGDLQKHIRTHTGEKPFKCPIEGCDKSFSTSNIRKVHVRSHTGERPYICTFSDCAKAFSSATNYKNHIRIHSGEKPYCCPVLGCGKRFTEYSSLYKHKVVHDPVKLVKCCYNGCYQNFKSEGLLKHHMRMMHNVVYVSETSANYILLPKEDTDL